MGILELNHCSSHSGVIKHAGPSMAIHGNPPLGQRSVVTSRGWLRSGIRQFHVESHRLILIASWKSNEKYSFQNMLETRTLESLEVCAIMCIWGPKSCGQWQWPLGDSR